MSMHNPKLRGSKSQHSAGKWPIGQIPDSAIYELAKHLAYEKAIASTKLSGDGFGDIFATIVGGQHKKSNEGVVDVIWQQCAWSLKTVGSNKPHETGKVRLISGRNSPSYSFGINDPQKDPQRTGDAVLSIWNKRIQNATSEYADLRIAVLIRNMESLQFTIFEEAAAQFATGDFTWQINTRGNLEGFHKTNEEHHFTWQPHGSQFTILRKVPPSARKFAITHKISQVSSKELVWNAIGYDQRWISILP